jgi:inorganic pyrophosphatase
VILSDLRKKLQVGDNVGDIAGMGADLFGSFAESTCAALVIAAAAVEHSNNTLSAAGWDEA